MSSHDTLDLTFKTFVNDFQTRVNVTATELLGFGTLFGIDMKRRLFRFLFFSFLCLLTRAV